MKNLSLLIVFAAIAFHATAQITDIQVRFGADIWKLGYTASSLQINCGLCPQLIEQQPNTVFAINSLKDSLISENYINRGAVIAVSGAIWSPAIRAEIQISPSMRKLDGENAQGRYVNRNFSTMIGINPLQFSKFAGRFYLGETQKLFLDFSDGGVYAQFSYDGGFEEYVRSTNNIALMARWQPTLWTSDQKRFGIALRGGAKVWMLGNENPEGPFLTPTGLPKKVRPDTDWFMGAAIRMTIF
ncbi:MAG: hypothetical protein R3D00_25340 [Bacteroidia bacterium]